MNYYDTLLYTNRFFNLHLTRQINAMMGNYQMEVDFS